MNWPENNVFKDINMIYSMGLFKLDMITFFTTVVIYSSSLCAYARSYCAFSQWNTYGVSSSKRKIAG